jgi:hypothetical protein
MATILIVGSHPALTRYATESLRSGGYDAIGVVGPEAGLKALGRHEVDLLIVGGPAALAERSRLETRLRERNRWAPVVVPNTLDDLVEVVQRAFGGDAH